MKRAVALLLIITLLLTSLNATFAEGITSEAYLNEDFESVVLNESWKMENVGEAVGNNVLVSDNHLEVIRNASAEQPIIYRDIKPASGKILLEFSGRNGTGSERAQDVLTIGDTDGRIAARFRFFGKSLQIKTADTTNTSGALDFAAVASMKGNVNASIKVILDTDSGTLDVFDASSGEMVLANKKFVHSTCKDISRVTIKGTSRFVSGYDTASVFIDYINIYNYYESTAKRDIESENWQIPKETAESFLVPLTGAFGSEYTWESSDEDIIRFDGTNAKVYPADGEDKTVTVKVTANDGSHLAIKQFTIKVKQRKWYNYFLTEDMSGALTDGVKFGADSEEVYDSNVGKCMYTRSNLSVTLPKKESGTIYFAMKLKIPESATLSVYAENAGDRTTSFDFAKDGRMTIRVDSDTKNRTTFKKNQWFDFKVRIDYVNFCCDVWIDDVLRIKESPFEYEKASYNIERLGITTDTNGFYIKDLNIYRDSYDTVQKDAALLSLPEELIGDINLPLFGVNSGKIVWKSENNDIIEIPNATELDLKNGFITAKVNNPVLDTDVMLTAEVYEGEYSKIKSFNIKVIHKFTDEEIVKYVTDNLDIGDEGCITGDLFLPRTGEYDTIISWESDNESAISSKGVVSRKDHQDCNVKLKATVSKNAATYERVFNITVQKRFSVISDPDIITDEEFFGVWSGKEWSVLPSFNYDYNQKTKVIESYVKKGDYTSAKQALLDYYKLKINNKEVPLTDTPTSRDVNAIFLAINEIWNFSQREPYMNYFRVTNEKKEVSVDISKGFRSKKPSTFMLMSLTKGKCKTVFDSKEGTNPPRLELVINGNKKNVYAVADTYVRAENYKNRNYGTEKEIVICDSGAPTDDDTTRAYVSFDISFLKASDTINSAKLVFNASTDATTGYQDILVFNSGLQVFDEEELVWSEIPHKTYSWNSIPGGYKFTSQPDMDHHWQGWVAGPGLWLEPMIAEYNLTKDEFYPYYIISQLIKMYDCGVTDIDTRPVFSHLINNQYMTPEAFTALMKLTMVRGHEIYYEYQKRVDNLGFVSPDYAVFFPEFTDSASWWNILDENIRYLLDGGLMLEDGSYIESSNHYEIYVIGYMIDTYKAFVNNGKEPPYGLREALEELLLYVFNMTEPSLQITEWGDTTNNGGANVKNKFTEWLEAIPDMDIAEYVSYILSDGTKGEKPPFTSYFYPEGDLGVFRSDWNKNAVYSFINNRTGGIHLHPDALSLNVYGYGRRLLTDVGLSSYDNDDPVAYWQRSKTSAHNTIEINDKPQTAPYDSNQSTWAPAESEMIINGGFDMFTGMNDSNRDGTKVWRHSRNVLFVRPDFFIVSDLVTPPDDTSVNKYNQTWHTERFAQMSMDAATGVSKTNYTSGGNAKIIPLDPEKLNKSMLDGYAYGQSAKYASYIQNIKGAASYDTIIYPYDGDDVNISAERIDMAVPTSTATAFKLDIDGEISYYYYSHEETPMLRSFGDFQTDAKMAYVKMRADGTIESVSLADVSVLKLSGEEIYKSREKIGDIKLSLTDNKVCINSESEKNKEEIDAMYYTGSRIEKAELNGREIKCISNDKFLVFSSDYMSDKFSAFNELYKVSFESVDDIYKAEFTEIPSKLSGSEEKVECYIKQIVGNTLNMKTEIIADISKLDDNYLKKGYNGYFAKYTFDELTGKVNLSYKFKVDKGVERIQTLADAGAVQLRLLGDAIQAKTGNTQLTSGDFVTVKSGCVQRDIFHSIDILIDYDKRTVSVYFEGECIIDRHTFYKNTDAISSLILGGVSKISLYSYKENGVEKRNKIGNVWYDDITVTQISKGYSFDGAVDNLDYIKGDIRDGKLSFEYKSYNFSESDAERVVISAIYDEENNLVQSKVINGDLSAESAVYGKISYEYDEGMNGFMHRFFVWNAFDDITPVKILSAELIEEYVD